MFTADNHNNECYQRHAFDDNGEVHEEPDGAPHAAKVAVFAVAVFVLGKVGTCFCQGGTARVQAVGVVDWGAACLGEGGGR